MPARCQRVGPDNCENLQDGRKPAIELDKEPAVACFGLAILISPGTYEAILVELWSRGDQPFYYLPPKESARDRRRAANKLCHDSASNSLGLVVSSVPASSPLIALARYDRAQ